MEIVINKPVFVNHFNPSRLIMPLRRNDLRRVKEYVNILVSRKDNKIQISGSQKIATEF